MPRREPGHFAGRGTAIAACRVEAYLGPPVSERNRGFTLIELLMVVVIIGLLVSVLIPKFANSRDKGFQAAMKADLRNLASAQESYFYDHQTYTTSLSSLSFTGSRGVVLSVSEASGGGWSAEASHPNSSKRCYVFYGNASPIGTATQEGEIHCS